MTERGQRWFLTAGVALGAFNLRILLASVGPVLDELRDDLDLSATAVSVLISLPVLAFGLLASLTLVAVRYLPAPTVLTASFALIAIGLGVRVTGGVTVLFAGTLAACAAVAIANVLLPVVVKASDLLPDGPTMGVYVGSMIGGTSIAAALTVPVAAASAGGWRLGMGVWAVPALAACLVWAANMRTSGIQRRAVERERPGTTSSLLRDPLAWHVTLFMCLQSLGFFTLLSWLPSLFRANGIPADVAGNLVGLLVVVGVPVAFVVPRVMVRIQRQYLVPLTALLVTALGLVGTLLAPAAVPWLWSLFLGLGTGASFSAALMIVVLRSRSRSDATRLSTMSQGVGYTVAALGPLAFGFLHDVTGAWAAPTVLLIALLVPQGIHGVLASRQGAVVGAANPDPGAPPDAPGGPR